MTEQSASDLEPLKQLYKLLINHHFPDSLWKVWGGLKEEFRHLSGPEQSSIIDVALEMGTTEGIAELIRETSVFDGTPLESIINELTDERSRSTDCDAWCSISELLNNSELLIKLFGKEEIKPPSPD